MKTLPSIASTLVMGVSFVIILAMLCVAVGPARAQTYDTAYTIADGAQMDTIAFDGFAFITGNLDAMSFFPPGKVADYFGFQYLRDQGPNGIGHNTSFLTNCATNVLNILNSAQFAQLMTLANNQVTNYNLYAYKRFPLMQAFSRLAARNIPAGTTGLSLAALKTAFSDLYTVDGRLSFDRAVVYASIINSLTASQQASLNSMAAGGYDSWTVTDAMNSYVQQITKGVSNDVAALLMSYAGDIFSWYTGSPDADVYWCPERQGDYFGSFYMKDAPAVGNPDYQIDTTETGNIGQEFLNELAANHLDTPIMNLVDEQRDALYAGAVNILQVRTAIDTLLRSLIGPNPPSDPQDSVLPQVLQLSAVYGALDGQISYDYATVFATVAQSLTTSQYNYLAALRQTLLTGVYNGVPYDFTVCTTPYLYADVITDTSVLSTYISNTDYLFGYDSAAIHLSPLAATMQSGDHQQFSAFLSGTANTGVIWEVNGVTGGNATVGNISTTGVFNAPQVAPNPPKVTITAVSMADPAKSASATVTLCAVPAPRVLRR